MTLISRDTLWDVEARTYKVLYNNGIQLFACDWRARDEVALWTHSFAQAGNLWVQTTKPLTAHGREAMLQHFGLSERRSELDLNKMRELPPVRLMRMRRQLERRHHREPIHPFSCNLYDPVRAMFVC